MTPQEITNALRELRQRLMGASNRIRRYTLDSRLRSPNNGAAIFEPWLGIRKGLDESWTHWLDLRKEIHGLPATPTEKQCRDTQLHMLELERELEELSAKKRKPPQGDPKSEERKQQQEDRGNLVTDCRRQFD